MKMLFAAGALASALLFSNAANAGVVLTSLDPTLLDTSALSTGSPAPAGIDFINTLSYDVDIFWINYTGDRVFYRNLAAFTHYFQGTFITHPWIVAKGGTATLAQGTGLLLDGFLPVTASPTGLADFDLAYIRGAFLPVPEPATWALMIGGFGLAGAALRRRQRVAVGC